MSPITYKDMEIVVSRAVGPHVKILNYHLQLFSEGKNGIFGTHHSLTINVQDSSNGTKGIDTHTFFVKTLPESPIIQNLIMDEYMFLEEVHFYNEVHSTMIGNCNSERWSPRCYLAKRDTLIFEDLRAQGYTTYPDSFLDEQSLKSALSTLARFHASSIIIEKRLGKTLKEAYPNAFDEKLYTNVNKFGQSTIVGYDTIVSMAEKFNLNSNLVPKIYNRVFKYVRAQEGRCNVICHSDLWKNNLMFNNSIPPKCILVDYQLLRYASPAVDVGMLLYLHTTPEFRKKSEFDMFQHYYLVLQDTLLQNDSKDKIPSYESMLKDYQERRLVAMTYASLFLPGIYMKPEDFAALMNDPTMLERWFFHNRMDLIGASIDKDPVYEEKIKNIISELLDEGKRIFDE